jgi:hypothetical protein
MLTIYTLAEGVIYMVTKPFTDYHRNNFSPGDKLTYAGRAFLPYDGGHTLIFKEQNIYLQEDEDAALISSLHEHLTIFDATGRVDPANRPPPVRAPRERRKGFYYFIAFLIFAMIALLLTFFAPARPKWLPLVPFGIGFLILIAAVIAEWRHPV